MNLFSTDSDRSYLKAKELKNSSPLKLYKPATYPEVQAVVNHLFDEMVLLFDLNLSRKSTVTKLRYHLEFFVLNLYATHLKDPERFLAYSRDSKTYSDRKSRYKENSS